MFQNVYVMPYVNFIKIRQNIFRYSNLNLIRITLICSICSIRSIHSTRYRMHEYFYYPIE